MVDHREFYQNASMRICGNLEIEKAMSSCLLYLREFMPVDEMGLYLTDQGLGAIRNVARATAEGGETVNVIIPLPREGMEALTGSALPDIRIVNRAETDPVVRPAMEFLDAPESSYLIMFPKSGGQRMETAAAVLRANGRDRYRTDHLELFSILNEPFVIALSNYLKHMEVMKLKDLLADDNRYLVQQLHGSLGDEIVGGDFGLKPVMEKVRQVAPQSSTVLLYGETGVGKEVVADSIVRYSSRSDRPYIKINCGAIPPTLLDSELFGHEKGAFSGAHSRKRGRFERAHGGTIFLDEIGELTPEAQLRLLRVLQFGELERVGGDRTINVDIRVIAATHRDLPEMVRRQKFRQDLWFRLNVFPIHIPPLRCRANDIPALVHFLIEKKVRRIGLCHIPDLAPGAIDRLMRYNWPGNVRELENVIERALIINRGEPLSFRELEVASGNPDTEPDMGLPAGATRLDDVMAWHIRRVLDQCRGKINGPDGCAALLGVNPNTLRHRMKTLGIPFGRKVN